MLDWLIDILDHGAESAESIADIASGNVHTDSSQLWRLF